ncbi:hypothetical protein [Veronia pacifica]|uniref:Uncharacterized protein n=1 Tax=Veronia pacifica TaxID=1080227 RepID=A0A1C3EKV4_9GAMM|nr:hypothetical protein [Veronia pacifica]ODA33855.1 hypothetical protein A8L45_08485 [Veronia pacifica]
MIHYQPVATPKTVGDGSDKVGLRNLEQQAKIRQQSHWVQNTFVASYNSLFEQKKPLNQSASKAAQTQQVQQSQLAASATQTQNRAGMLRISSSTDTFKGSAGRTGDSSAGSKADLKAMREREIYAATGQKPSVSDRSDDEVMS